MKKALFVLSLAVFAILSFSCKKNAPQSPLGDNYSTDTRGGGGSAGSALQPCPIKSKRNNGQGTCGGDGQIRIRFSNNPTYDPILDSVYYVGNPDYAPRLDSIYYLGVKETGLTFAEGDTSNLAQKNYISYCFYGHNIPPDHKLTYYFSYPLSSQVCILPE